MENLDHTLLLMMKNQSYVLYVIFIMLVAGITKKYALFNDVFGFIAAKIKSKRAVVFLTSMVTGVMPVPGRVTVTAGILDNIAPDDVEKRARFGIMDYLGSHHYYLWSPLEKAVIIPMAALGLSYGAWLHQMLPLLVITFIISFGYIFIYTKEEDIELKNINKDYSLKRLLKNTSPFFLGIGALIFGFNPAIVFGIVFAYYLLFNRISFKEAYEFINFKLVFMLMGILAVTNLIKVHTNEITHLVTTMGLTMQTGIGFGIISAVAFFSAFFMGSSSRYAGIVALLSATFGGQYLVYYIALEFSAYLLSPFHKCLMIGKMYFGTKLQDYYTVIAIWSSLMIVTSLLIIR